MRVRILVALVALAAAASAGAARPPRLDPAHLPPLPERGLARQMRSGVALETLRGRTIGTLPKLHLASIPVTHGLVLEDARNRLFALDPQRRELRRVSRMPSPVAGCVRTDQSVQLDVLVCGRRIETVLNRGPAAKPRRRVVARAPRYRGKAVGGRWLWAELSPNARTILAQWSGECEIPTAFLVAGGTMRPFGAKTYAAAPESTALGWLPDGRAVVALGSGACGSGYRVPGVYAVGRSGRPELLRRSGPTPQLFAMWGG